VHPAMRLIRFLSLFFSCRSRHTSFSRDWSSDVCSSDLGGAHCDAQEHWNPRHGGLLSTGQFEIWTVTGCAAAYSRRVGGVKVNEIGRASCRERVECDAGSAEVRVDAYATATAGTAASSK